MNILFTVSYYLPYISGITIHANRLADALSVRGNSVTVITSQFNNKLPKNELTSGVRIIRIPVKMKLHKGFIMPTYVFELWKQIDKSDIVVSHLPQFEAIFAAIFAKLKRKKFYVIYHCEVKLPKGLLNKIIELLLHSTHYLSLKLADKIITYTKDYAINSSLLPRFLKKTIYVYPPIPSLINKNYSNNKNIPTKRKIIIGVAARLAAEKGFEYLFSSIEYLQEVLKDNFTIRIAGPMNPAGEKAYGKILQPLMTKYESFISFSGSIKPTEMGSFYKSLDLLVLPSINKTEAFGMVQVEAMLCGIPVVTSDLPGVRVPVQVTGMGELAIPADSKSLADKILLVLHNKEKYSKNASELKKIFSYEKTIRSYEEVFIGFS